MGFAFFLLNMFKCKSMFSLSKVGFVVCVFCDCCCCCVFFLLRIRCHIQFTQYFWFCYKYKQIRFQTFALSLSLENTLKYSLSLSINKLNNNWITTNANMAFFKYLNIFLLFYFNLRVLYFVGDFSSIVVYLP